MNRRNFNKTLLAGGSSILLSPNISIANALKGKQEKSVIFVFLSGGISATEFINPVPNSPVEFRSVRGFSQMKNGEYLGGDFEKLASIGNELTVVRNFHHRDGNHQTATKFVMSGTPDFSTTDQKNPSLGSLVAHKYGPINIEKGIPNYVRTRKIEGDEAAWLGAKYIGMTADEDGVGNLFPKISRDRFSKRMEMMRIISKASRLDDPISSGWLELKNQAEEIIKGEAGVAFDLTKESPENIQKYNANNSSLGKDLLLTRRLLQAGAKFITVTNGGWDNHNNISDAFDRKGAELDRSLFTLLNDLHTNDMLDNTLVVVASEFSRTKLNNQGGRDHNPNVNSLIFAGGGFSHGKVIGKTDDHGLLVDGKSYGPQDLAWTISKYLGLSKDLVITNNQSRPIHIFDSSASDILS